MIKYGNEVFLRSIKKNELEKLRRWRNNPAIHKWCRQVGLISEMDQQRWYERQNDDPSIQMFTVGDSMNVLGVCGLTDIDPVNRRAEFSLYIAPENQGQGYGRKALVTILAYGFNALNLNRIWGETFEGNPALKLFKSLGFDIEGKRNEFFYRDGRYIDCTLVSIGRAAFDAIHTSTDDTK